MSKDGIDFSIVGMEQTIKAFQQIADASFKKRKVKVAERRAGKIYLNAVKRLSRGVIDDDGKLSDSFGLIRSGRNSSKDWISIKYGPRVKGKYKANIRSATKHPRAKRSSNYRSGGWLAAFYEYGTENRRTESTDANRGAIKKRRFKERAFKATSSRAEMKLKRELLRVLNESIREAQRKGMKFKP